MLLYIIFYYMHKYIHMLTKKNDLSAKKKKSFAYFYVWLKGTSHSSVP